MSPGNVFDVLELMVESHLDLHGIGSVAIFVDAVVRRPENPQVPPSILKKKNLPNAPS